FGTFGTGAENGFRICAKYGAPEVQDSFLCPKVPGTDSAWTGHKIEASDFNGDGVDDLLHYGEDNIHFCAGPGIIQAENCLRVHDQPWSQFRKRIGDFNGDGATDLYLFGEDESYFVPGRQGVTDHVTAIT